MQYVQSPLPPDEPIKGLPGCSISDYWAWAYSNVLSNTERGAFAEYLVAFALGISDRARRGWEEFDLEYEGLGIEVKSSAYVQAWAQKKLSSIIFGIGKTRSWNPSTNQMSSEANRSSTCYIFCLFKDQNIGNADVLHVEKWEFYVVSTALIDRKFGDKRTISLARLQEVSRAVRLSNLKDEVDGILASTTNRPNA